MSTIDVRHAHSLPKAQAKELAEKLAKSLEQKFNLEWHWSGDAIDFEAAKGVAKGTRGQVAVGDNDVRVSIDLPFMLKMLKGTVQSTVSDKLDELLAPSATPSAS